MKTITNLAVSNVKKNRTRSVLVMISILLTTMLLTIIASVGTGIIRSGKQNAGLFYGDYEGSYNQINETQLQEMQLQSEFKEIGKQSYVAMVDNAEADMQLYWADEQAQKDGNILRKLKSGKMPEKEDEIAAPKEFFQKSGLENPQIGDSVEVYFRRNTSTKFESKTFQISGIISSNELSNLASVYQAYISQAFFEKQVPTEQRSYMVSFKLNDSVAINADNGEEVLKELAKKCGIDTSRVSSNYLYLMYTREPGIETISACIMIALLVIVLSVVVIYNIFQVGIVQKIQEYGKIRALGATKKQMKSLIFKEGMLAAMAGIPAGLLLGLLGAALLFKKFFESGQTRATGLKDVVSVSVVSLPLLLLVAVVSLLTVWLALKKPMRIVASVSPIEAVRYQEGGRRKNNLRKGKKKMSVWRMTMANLSANRRRTAATICTMGLSCVLFVALANLAGNIDNEYEARKAVAYGRFFLDLDCVLEDEAYPENNLENVRKQNPLGKELQERIKAIDGVTEVKTRKIIAANENNKGNKKPSGILVLNREEFETYAKEANTIGTLDYDVLTKENGIAYTWSHFMEDNGYHLGQKIELELLDGDRTIPYTGTLKGSFGNLDGSWVITEDTCKKLGLLEHTVTSVWVDCNAKDEKKVENAIKELITGVEYVELTTWENTMEQVEMQTGMMQGGIYGVLAILGCIGFMNMANTIITGVITRKRELGVLQAVGMTNRQLNQMLQLEGIIFSAGTILVALGIGCPMGYALFQYGLKNSIYGLNEYHIPIMEIGIMIAAIVLLQCILSFFLSRNLRKETLVERINNNE